MRVYGSYRLLESAVLTGFEGLEEGMVPSDGSQKSIAQLLHIWIARYERTFVGN